ncbi:MAG: exopolysaccharide biosynthesis polyprenyl glycosylphosphotransferase [Prevotella sp.]|nr:exopolysaccharide biosynthesis polyprenyl glycosylphosphotransferase [Prevotella sp.]
MRHNTRGNDIIRVLVILSDFVLLNTLILFLVKYLPSDMVPLYFVNSLKEAMVIANFAMLIAEYSFHTIIVNRKVQFSAILSRALKLTLTQAILMFVGIRLMVDSGRLFQFTLIFTPCLLVLIVISRFGERNILKIYRKRGGNTRSVVFVGSDPANLLLYQDLNAEPTTGYIIKGYFSNNVIEDCPPEFKKLGNIATLIDKMDSEDEEKEDTAKHNNFRLSLIDEMFCCLSHDDTEEIIRIMSFCDNHFIHFHYVPRMYGNFRLNLKVEQFGDMTLYTNLREPLTYMSNKIIKRSFDVVFSLIMCILMLPFIPIIATIIMSQSRGPIFFKQRRTGLNGKEFICYKFRSMHVNDQADTNQATKDDPRKYPFGEFMRRYNIDELPQFINVLIGDMSVVGPRPHMTYHTDYYKNLIDKYMVRHFSKPGITGWAQISGFRGETKELWQMAERIRRDIWYIENWSFWLDMKIILLTFTTFFKHDKNAY